MNLELQYLGRSSVVEIPGGAALAFRPNLARPKVFFDQALRFPVRFREAISALHEVVVGDLRFKPRGRAAYQAYLEEERRVEAELRRAVVDQAKKAELAKLTKEPPAPNLEVDFRRMHRLYWNARTRWADELSRNDPELFRHLVPCDPVVTVAPDVVYFECFAKDESSYGCLFVDREAFEGKEAGLGTTNVDYSFQLYEHFQTLRSYRQTRLQVDPTGFEVKVQGQEAYREEKIDLPTSWLRGFGQVQAAMTLQTRRVELSLDAVYSLLAFLRRHREKTGPRSLRFQLAPGRPASVVLEPFGVAVQSHGAPYEGEKAEEIKVWGRRRLMVLARLLPLAERVEVQLLGSGLPSVWTVHMGEMRMVLGLSGWTANEWSGGTSLELLCGQLRAEPRTLAVLSRHLQQAQFARLTYLCAAAEAPRDAVLGSLHQLAKQGQVLYDFAGQCYRWRQLMPVALSEALLGPEPPEVAAGRQLFREGKLSIVREELLSGARRLLVGKVGEQDFEAILDGDGGFSKARCGCSHFFKLRLRGGPCRHLIALRLCAQAADTPATESDMEPPGPTGPKKWIH
ncbi:MAG: SWIM zinc finger family protein [Myxococcales bacterium]|nr:SWIM zinc finger family protein [Myxococcales bacterium]